MLARLDNLMQRGDLETSCMRGGAVFCDSPYTALLLGAAVSDHQTSSVGRPNIVWRSPTRPSAAAKVHCPSSVPAAWTWNPRALDTSRILVSRSFRSQPCVSASSHLGAAPCDSVPRQLQPLADFRLVPVHSPPMPSLGSNPFGAPSPLARAFLVSQTNRPQQPYWLGMSTYLCPAISRPLCCVRLCQALTSFVSFQSRPVCAWSQHSRRVIRERG
jgi:hypothetical protein